MAIQFDPINLLARMVGDEDGLTDVEIAKGSAAAVEALRSFERASRDGIYGFPHLPFQQDTIKQIQKYASDVRGAFDTVCVVGIGGSALGSWAIDCAMRGPHPVQPAFSRNNPRLVILDNVDPDFIQAALDSMNPRSTLIVPIAKSGSTAETVATFLIVHDWLVKKVGRKSKERIAVVTSAGRGDLKALATREGWQTFHLPDNVGGRFSVLSAVGLLPAALIGVDIKKLTRGAAEMTSRCWKPDLETNIALRAALYHYLTWMLRKKTIQVAFPYSNRLWGTAFWFRQLWAESLGKAKNRAGQTVNSGQTPVAALGTTDQHSQVQLYMEGPNDKVFSFWRVAKFDSPGRIPKAKTGFESFDSLRGQSLAKLIDAEQRATEAALTAQRRPNCCYTLDRVDASHVGAFFQLLEFETAFIGELLNINAFDQEGVELGKKFTFALMGRKGFESYQQQFKTYQKSRAN